MHKKCSMLNYCPEINIDKIKEKQIKRYYVYLYCSNIENTVRIDEFIIEHSAANKLS